MILKHSDRIRELGGPGSGNWGHAGIPGQRGGSAPKGSGGGGESKGKNESKAQKESKIVHASGPGSEKGHWDMPLSTEEFDSLQDYGQSGYRSINGDLYKGKISKGNQKTIDTLDSILDRAVLDSDVTVYSGLGERSSAIFAQLDEGSEIDFAGYLSTTTSEKNAQTFQDTSKEGKVWIQRRLQIDLPKGSNAFHMGDNDYEKEIMLKRGQKYKINKISKTGQKKKIITYHVSVVS